MEYAWIPFAVLAGVLMIIFQILFIRTRYERSRERMFEESFQKPLYETECSVILDNESAERIPFDRLSIYTGFLVIGSTKQLLLRKEDIDNLEIKRVFLSNGLQIYHHAAGAPKKIIITKVSDVDSLKRTIIKNLSLELV